MGFLKNFFNLEKDTFGLDIGQHAIKIAAFKKSGKNIKLIAYSRTSIDFPIFGQNNLLNKVELAEKIKEAISTAKPHRLTRKNVVISLPESKVFLKIIKIPGNLSEAEIKNAIFWQAKQEIPLKPNEAEFSFSIIKKTPQETEVLLVAAPKTLLEDYLEVVRKAGLELVAVEVDPIAQARALIGGSDKEKTVLICDISLKNIGLVLWSQGGVRLSGTILMGEENLYSILRETFPKEKQISSFKDAKRLYSQFPRKFESAFSRPFSQIENEIGKIISFFQRENGAKLDKIILTGGGAEFPYLKKYLNSHFKKPVKLADPRNAWANLDISSLSSEDIYVYNTAIGLALREFEDGKD